MDRFEILAERGAMPLLRLAAAVRLLFFLAFLASLFIAVSKASAAGADSAVCTGKDLLNEIEQKEPAVYEKILAEAGAAQNGTGLLWKVESDGRAPSYLFGTMHVTDQRVTKLTPAAQAAFDASDTVVIETTEVLDQGKMLAELSKTPELMMFTDDTTLTSLLPADEAKLVNQALDERGIPPFSVSKMKPWIIAAMVAMPACELNRKAGGAAVLDVKLASDAQAAGKTLAGLETVADQLGAMASLPMDFHLRGLVETLKLGDRVDDVLETMVILYGREEIGMIWPLIHAALPQGPDEQSDYADFEEAMITARNRTMAQRAEPILERGGAFIAVGAMHLPGPEGLVALLRKAGYTVSRAVAS